MAQKSHKQVREFVKSHKYGTVFKYKNELWFYSKGLCGNILTNTQGNWIFVDDIKAIPGEKSSRNWDGIDWNIKDIEVVFYS